MQFIRLTELGTNGIIFLNIDHIISFYEVELGTLVKTIDGAEYEVEELPSMILILANTKS